MKSCSQKYHMGWNYNNNRCGKLHKFGGRKFLLFFMRIAVLNVISIISDSNKAFPAIWLVERFLILAAPGSKFNIFEAWLLSKYGRHLWMNFSVIYLEDITASLGYLKAWRILRNDCCRPETKKFSEINVQKAYLVMFLVDWKLVRYLRNT